MRILETIRDFWSSRPASIIESDAIHNTLELFQERIDELELALEDQGWLRLAAESQHEFSRAGLANIIKASRLGFLKNPLINRAVTLQATYVWAQGVQIEAVDPDVADVVTAFLDDPKNTVELTGHQARTMKEQDLQVFGNLFFAFFTDEFLGRVTLRTIPVDEIQEIICNPEDSKDPWFYKRVWNEQTTNLATGQASTRNRTAYYPDWQLIRDANSAERIGQVPVVWDTPVYHVRVGGLSEMRFGVPEVYQSLDWARAYKSFLEDWATIVRSYARFAWNVKSGGGAKQLALAKDKLASTLGSGGRSETNPAPVTGAAFVSAGDAAMMPIRTAGATTSAEDGRRLLLMVAASFGLPESFFGDVSVGTLATAKSLDRPTELKFRDRQELWKSVLADILGFVVQRSIDATNGQLRGRDDIDRTINITFPPILEHDVREQIGAIVSAATLDGKALAGTMDMESVARLLLNALAVSDVNEILDRLPDQVVKAPGVAEALRRIGESLDSRELVPWR